MGEYSQWHYIAGYLVVLTSHNWPIMLCLALGFYHAARLYRRPCPADVRRLYGWGLFGLAYEYHKHLQGVADEAVDFLLVWTFWRWNRWGHGLVAAVTPLLIGLAVWMLWASLRAGGESPARLARPIARHSALRRRGGGAGAADAAAGDRR